MVQRIQRCRSSTRRSHGVSSRDANPSASRSGYGVRARTIVGVVKDERINGLAREAPPAIYLPYRQAPSFNGAEALLVRASGAVTTLGPSLRAAVRQVDPQLAVFGVQPLADAVGDSVAQQRFVMLLLIAFAGVAVILAAIGIHGVLSYTVAQRRHELGIRVALGATPGARDRTRAGAGSPADGHWAGDRRHRCPGAHASARDATVRRFDHRPDRVRGGDPGAGAVAMLATWLPARKAVRLDPLEAMRD